MKALVCLTFSVSALTSPTLTFAQATSGQLTRAQMRADIVRVAQAGCHPGGGDNDYPVEIQAAEAKIAEQDGARLADDSAGGVAQAGSSQTGMATNAISPGSLHAGP